MRVGLVSPYSWSVPGGVNDHVANLAAQLELRGHEAWIMAPHSGRASAKAALPERFISMGNAMPFPSNGSKAWVNPSPLLLRRFDRVLPDMHFDILHAHEPCTPSVAAAAVLRTQCPVVGTFHAALDSSLFYTTLFPLAKRVMENITVRIAVSEAAREYPDARFPGEFRIIPNGVPIELYERARKGTRRHGRVLFIGRAEPRKGIAVLLEAFAMVRRQMPRATLQLVGPSWDQVIGVAPQPSPGYEWPMAGVTALGRVGHDEKVDEMAAAEVLCVPSLEGESFGIVIAEGMAAGLPVVASDLPGYRAVLGDGDSGVLVPPGDAVALAEALLRLFKIEGLRTRLTEAGLRTVEQFAWPSVAERVIEAYEEARRARAPRSR
jgi:phosphatidylinositol alpha-mannosyltransferase